MPLLFVALHTAHRLLCTSNTLLIVVLCRLIDTHKPTQQMSVLVCMQHIDGINLFGLISIAALVYCVPAAFIVERHLWSTAWDTAVLKLGTTKFYQLLGLSGLFYHLYNQV